MDSKSVPADAPPTYDDATASSSSRTNHTTSNEKSGGFPTAARDEEERPLPKGWVRSFDPQSNHPFWVDTAKDPPRSIWVHPYEDADYLATLSPDERRRIEGRSNGLGSSSGHADKRASYSGRSESDEHLGHPASGELPPRPDNGKGKGRSLGQRFKNKLTKTSHEEREAERQRRVVEESRAYEHHQLVRAAMARAAETGEPQLIGKDSDGKDVYIEPPPLQMGPAGFGYNASDYNNATGRPAYNPYTNPNNPNARYVRPSAAYNRPYGGGYGGGYGMPLMLGMGGGLMGGMLMMDMMGGGII